MPALNIARRVLLGSTLAAGLVVAYPNVAAFLGHSFVELNIVTSGGTLDRAIRGWANWTSAFGKGKLRVPRSHILGYSGADTPTVLSHLSEALALNPKPGFLFVDTGSNDMTKSDGTRPSASDFLTTLANAFATIRAAGIMPVAKTINFRTIDGVSALSANQAQWRLDVNAGLRAMASPATLRLIDDSEAFGGTINNRCYDTIHPDGPGARQIGLNGWNAIADLVTAAPAVIPPAGNLFTNSALSGAGGTKNGTVSGNAPTGWTCTQSGSSGTTVTLSTVAALDGGADWLQAVIVAGAGGRGGFELRQGVPAVVGDTVQCGYDLEIEGAANAISQLSAELRTFGNALRSTHLPAVNFNQILNDAGATLDQMRMETYPFTLPSGVTSQIFYINGIALAGQTVTMRVRNPWATKA